MTLYFRAVCSLNDDEIAFPVTRQYDPITKIAYWLYEQREDPVNAIYGNLEHYRVDDLDDTNCRVRE